MPKKDLLRRVNEALRFSLGVKRNETLLVVLTPDMQDISDLMIDAKLDGRKPIESNESGEGYNLRTLEVDGSPLIYELSLTGKRPLDESSIKIVRDVLAGYEIAGTAGLFYKNEEEQKSFRIPLVNFFRESRLRYLHVPAMNPKTLRDQWERLLPDNVNEWIKKVKSAYSALHQEGLVGLHFQGENGTDYVHFINNETDWNNDVFWKPGNIVQWPMGEVFDESDMPDLDHKGTILKHRKGYGRWVGNMGMGGWTHSFVKHKAKVTVYIGVDEDMNPVAGQEGIVQKIEAVQGDKMTVFTHENLQGRKQKHTGLAGALYDLLHQYVEKKIGYFAPYVQEVAIGFNTGADGSSRDILEGEKAGPHLAIGLPKTHIDFVGDQSVYVTAMFLKEKTRGRVAKKPKLLEEYLGNRPNWDRYFDRRILYRQGEFVK